MCGLFNIEDGRKLAQHFWHIMLCHFKKGKKSKTQKKICAVCGMCQKWFAKFLAGGFSLDDAPRSGKPVKVDNKLRH